jgi:hypothetical protein
LISDFLLQNKGIGIMRFFKKQFKEISTIRIGIMFVLALGLIFLSVSVVHDLARYESTGIFHRHRSIKELLKRNKGLEQIDLKQADGIAPWMTFRFVNIIFSMPENYLKDKLSIADSRYPDMTIDKCANSTNRNKTSFLEEVKSTVRDFIKNLPAENN